ncbi:MAG: hypothetical protein D6682_01025 [Zetaproteobacteria bacterium]|nr:MAG: hypothetical protein D6682_01025 [Zetaproteobacteria bacterium]
MVALLLLAAPAAAAPWNRGVDARADALAARLDGRGDYHAEFARALADRAVEEAAQHDLPAARRFIGMAEQEADRSMERPGR